MIINDANAKRNTVGNTASANVRFGLSNNFNKTQYAFALGQFMPSSNYARQLRFMIRQKLNKSLEALGNSNGQERKRYNFVDSDLITPERKQGRPVESAGGGKASCYQ